MGTLFGRQHLHWHVHAWRDDCQHVALKHIYDHAACNHTMQPDSHATTPKKHATMPPHAAHLSHRLPNSDDGCPVLLADEEAGVAELVLQRLCVALDTRDHVPADATFVKLLGQHPLQATLNKMHPESASASLQWTAEKSN